MSEFGFKATPLASNFYFAEVKTELQTVVVVVGIQLLEKPQKFEKFSCPVGSAQSLRKLSRNLWVYTD